MVLLLTGAASGVLRIAAAFRIRRVSQPAPPDWQATLDLISGGRQLPLLVSPLVSHAVTFGILITLVKSLRFEGISNSHFSPSGKYLIVHVVPTQQTRVVRTADWETVATLPGIAPCIMSRDDQFLANCPRPGTIDLYFGSPWKQFAQLTIPHKTRLIPIEILRDPAQLIAFGWSTSTIHVFHLGKIRAGLTPWGWPQTGLTSPRRKQTRCCRGVLV